MLGSTVYALCVYDTSGGVPTLVTSATAPAGGICSGRPCWTETAAGFRYRNTALTPDGILSIALNRGAEGRASIIVKGRGDPLHIPALPLVQGPTVTVQLVNSDGNVCWESVYAAPAVTNTTRLFRDVLP